MQMVIDIPDNSMDYIDSYEKGSLFDIVLTNAVKNGTPLPKGHGKLIDEDELKKEAIRRECSRSMYSMLEHILSYMKPIIEAERSDEK